MGDGAQRGAALRGEADRQERHRDRQRGRRDRRQERYQSGASESGDQSGHRPLRRLNQPVEADADRQDERREEHPGAEGQSRPFPAAEPVEAGRSGLHGSGRGPRSAFEAACCSEYQQGREHQQEGESRRGVAIQRSADLVVDGPGERLVAQQRDGAEVTQGVQGRKQPAREQRRGQQRQGHPPEPPPAASAQHPGGILERSVHHRKPGARRQIHIRIVEEHKYQEGAREAVDLGKPLPSREGFEGALEEPARSQRGRHGEGRDVGGDRERQSQQPGQEAPARKIGPRGEPGQRQPQPDRSQGDGRRQQQRPSRDPEAAFPKQYIKQPTAGHRPPRQIDERQQAHRRDHDPGGAEPPRRQAGEADRSAHRFREAQFIVSPPSRSAARGSSGRASCPTRETAIRAPSCAPRRA